MQENKTYKVGMINLTYGNVNYLNTGDWYTQSEAEVRAKELNETHLTECQALGYHKFVAYNMQAEFKENYIWNNFLG